MTNLPEIKWIKNDPKKHQVFTDGSLFLVALVVKNNREGTEEWEFDIVRVSCDGARAELEYQNGDSYNAWEWKDFEYFCVLKGKEPRQELVK